MTDCRNKRDNGERERERARGRETGGEVGERETRERGRDERGDMRRERGRREESERADIIRKNQDVSGLLVGGEYPCNQGG